MHDEHDEQIVPDERIGPFRLRQPAGPQRARLTDAEEEDRDGVLVIRTRDVSLFIEGDVVTQVGIHGEHPGRTADGLRLGTPLAEVRGKLVADLFDEVLRIEGVAGLCFTTDEGMGDIDDADHEEGAVLELPGKDRITWIGVYVDAEGDGERDIVDVVLT
jgi:hypothetical protein